MTTTERASADTLVDRPSLRSLVEDLHERRERARLGGGEEKIAQQHERNKLTARERLALLIDEGRFTELGIHGRPHFSQRAMEGREDPADGEITGYGKVDGRLVAVAAYDFTVMAGSMGMTGEMKVARLRELALGKRIPMIWLLDSAGARIQEAVGSLFAGSGHLFREEVIMSGVIPQVAALMGPCAAGTAYIPGLADFVPMVRGRGSMALAGPHLVRAAIGEVEERTLPYVVEMIGDDNELLVDEGHFREAEMRALLFELRPEMVPRESLLVALQQGETE